MEKEKINKKKLITYLTILVAALILGTVTATYAFFQATTDSETIAKTTIVGKTDCIKIEFSTDSNRAGLDLDYPITDEYAMQKIQPVIVSIHNTCEAGQDAINYTLTLSTFAKSSGSYMKDSQIRTNIKKAEPYASDTDYQSLIDTKYLDELLRVSNDEGYNNRLLTDHFKELQKSGGDEFSDFNYEAYDTITNYVIDTSSVTSQSENKYKIYLWVDYYEGDKNAYKEGSTHDESYDNTTENHNFESLVSLIVNNKEEGVEPPKELAETIKEKSTEDVTKLGSQDNSNDGYLIYHDGTGDYGKYEAGDKSYRFSGNNPDNYVCLDGNVGTGTCEKSKLYRVIGIYPTDESESEYRTKLIKSEYLTDEELGKYLLSAPGTKKTYDDYTSRADVDNAVGFLWGGDDFIRWNDWKSSTLNKTLNDEDGPCLTSLRAYIDLIEKVNWYIGGNTYDKITQQDSMKEAYENELGDKKLTESSQSCTDEISGSSYNFVQCTNELLYQENKVGLMYLTEYGYASAPSNWNKQLSSYNVTANRSVNWLYNGVNEWTLSRNSGYVDFAFFIDDSGYVNSGNYVYSSGYSVRPVIVLKSEATVKSGDGSKLSPWRINLPSS